MYVCVCRYVCMYVYYTYTNIIELCQQIFIYNEEAQCTSQTSCAQVLELLQSHFGDNRQPGGHIVFNDYICVMPILLP